MSLTEAMGILSDRARIRIMHVLVRHELSVGEVARIVQLPQPTVSRHLKQLHQLKLVRRRSEGTSSLYRVPSDDLPSTTGELWRLVATSVEPSPEDLRRLQAVLEQRRMNSSQFFDQVAQRWTEVRQTLFGDDFVLPTLLTMLPPDRVIADLGCGPGITLAQLAPVSGRVIGVDRERSMLKLAEQRNAEFDNVELRYGGLDALPIDDAEVHLTLAMLVLHHVENVQASISEMRRVIRPHGQAILLDMIPHQRNDYAASMGHQHLGFSREQLEDFAANAGLKLASYRVLPANPAADGPGLFIARMVPIN